MFNICYRFKLFCLVWYFFLKECNLPPLCLVCCCHFCWVSTREVWIWSYVVSYVHPFSSSRRNIVEVSFVVLALVFT